MIGKTHPVSDVCLLCQNIETSIEFYRDKLGFKLRRRAEGFADFATRGVTVALWEIGHFSEHVGYPDNVTAQPIHKVMTAVEIENCEELDRIYASLKDQGVAFINPPKEYPWNAYCAYFLDPDDNIWELYTWIGEGPDDYHKL